MLFRSACGSSSSSTAETKKVTYSSILKEYDQKMSDATPKLVDEFNEEADGVTDVNSLAQISTSKVEDLAKICNEGVEKMAKLKIKNDDSDDTYNEWAGKLQDKYTAYAQKITDAYTAKATASLG